MRMEGNVRTWFTPKQKAELWERWKSGQCVADIARALGRRNKSGVIAAGSIVGTFIGGRLLGFVPTYILLPLLAAVLVISAVKVWRHQ
jgi:uncharacterized membrane protein YfcA